MKYIKNWSRRQDDELVKGWPWFAAFRWGVTGEIIANCIIIVIDVKTDPMLQFRRENLIAGYYQLLQSCLSLVMVMSLGLSNLRRTLVPLNLLKTLYPEYDKRMRVP